MLHRVNLLPWRDAKRQYHQRRFFVLAFSVLILGGLAQWGAGVFIEYQQNEQQQRIVFLQAHIASLDYKLSELKRVEQQHESLMTRLKVVEDLQEQRNKTTYLMNLVPTLIPEGVYVDKIKMNGERIELTGISDTTSRLATMLDHLENSKWLSNVEMHSIVHDKARFGQKFQTFNVSFLFQPQEIVEGENPHG
ncbi:PilN domain-containing protein [Vibrio renipiscarius]|uniref:Pilus assembly protein PilN n=1 Tax=Vibrio renipiscarius TaxID=1461322 RepID=A0A0C2NDN5_9VIBR|nr:PilN domain-containing protein [Vibrio renipiscarius]KII77716.1 pilus assembly protein PilN [Vibrio renipiscarius]KII81540.1 pilus assembly protein PilN [Vibrio renipiscarius]